MNRRAAESARGGQNIEVKNIVIFFQKLLLLPPEADSIVSFGLPTLRVGPQFRYSTY
jgi:hypothetical protein